MPPSLIWRAYRFIVDFIRRRRESIIYWLQVIGVVIITWYVISSAVYYIMGTDTPSGGGQKPPKSKPKYPSGVPNKFDPDGNVQRFLGNTIISHLSPDSELYAALLPLYDKLAAYKLSHLYALLPPSSWHMTVFEGVVDKKRTPGSWPSDLASDAPLSECDALFAKKLSVFDLACDPPYKMKIVGWSSLKSGLGIAVEGSTPEEDKRIRGLRKRLADTLLIEGRDFETYDFHISMAYLLRHLTPEQKTELNETLYDSLKDLPQEFELGAPEFCTFTNMFAFERQFYLSDHKSA